MIQALEGLGLGPLAGPIGRHAGGIIWGFPKIRGTLLGVPIIRTIVFGGLYWGSSFWGNYHIQDYIGFRD